MDNGSIFEDRVDAGKALAEVLLPYQKDQPIILALPRGGVVLGYEVAARLHAPLSVIVSRKIGVPGNPEFGVGAVSEEGVEVLDTKTLHFLHIPEKLLTAEIAQQIIELKRRVALYRNGKELPDVAGETVILIDDGLATGVTAKAAIEALKKLHAKKIIFAAPICAYDTAKQIEMMVSQTVCLATPLDMRAIGAWYRYFPQVTDEEVIEILKQANDFSKKGKGKYQTSSL